METTEKKIGKTIYGGDYSIAYYFDKDGNPAPKDKASNVRIVEFTNEGKRVMEIYASI